MARKATVKSNLDELVVSFGDNHYKEAELKKVCDTLNKEIKQSLEQEHTNTHTAGNYKVTVTEIEKESVDEQQMLEILKKDWSAKYGSMECPYIKRREYVDFDTLEATIYAGELSKETMLELEKCRTITTQKRLTIAKVKKGGLNYGKFNSNSKCKDHDH